MEMSVTTFPYADFQVPWMKPYCRHTMTKVRKNKDLLLLVCLISMACPNFGYHNLPPLDIDRFDHHSHVDP
eukprot:5383626-Heterocapsa_arctica.AAC.1